MWANKWDTGVDYLETNIHVANGKDNVNCTNNPEDYVLSSQWTTQDTLTTS